MGLLGTSLEDGPMGASLKDGPIGASLEGGPMGASLEDGPMGASLEDRPPQLVLGRLQQGAALVHFGLKMKHDINHGPASEVATLTAAE